MMEKAYSEILGKGLQEYAKVLAQEQNTSEENIRIVIKIHSGQLGVFLFNESKFIRKIELVELVRILM